MKAEAEAKPAEKAKVKANAKAKTAAKAKAKAKAEAKKAAKAKAKVKDADPTIDTASCLWSIHTVISQYVVLQYMHIDSFKHSYNILMLIQLHLRMV